MTDQPPKSQEFLQSLLAKPNEAETAADDAALPLSPGDDEDVDALIDELEQLFSTARRVPFGKKLLIDEEQALQIVDRLRTAVPNEVKQAHRVLDQQDTIVSEAQTRARELLEERGLLAQLEREREQLLVRANADADRIRAEADKYVRRVLEELNDRLAQLQKSVDNGLATLNGE